MTTHTPTRRRVLQGSGALVLGVALPMGARAQSGAAAVIQGDGSAGTFAPNAFIRIATDDTVTVLIKHIEFGQGPMTGLSTLVAEELDADWAQMRAEHAPSDPERYKNLFFGLQGTGGSTAVANSWMQMRQAGAAARAMLVEAAAAQWGVPAGEISVANGVVSHPAGHQSGFGALAEAASALTPPAEPQLKDPAEFVLIGTDRPRLDTLAKSTGQAQYTIDVQRDGMVVVAVLHPPKFGAKLADFDATDALAVPGVVRVEAISSGVAVYATNTWAAFQGRDALSANWDESEAETRSSEEMIRIWAEAASRPATVAEETGDVDAALASAAVTHEAEFVFPFLAHAPMEPLDAAIEVSDAGAEVWMGSQLQTVDHQVVAGTLGLPPEQVQVHTMLAGGSFGRRAQPSSHVAREAAEIAKAAGKGAYKLVWTRENDIRGGYYRPLTVHRFRGGLDADGAISAWENTVANQSIVAGSPFEMLIQNGVDATSIEGSTKMPYAWPAHRVSWAWMEAKVPVLWWRSVGHTHTAYATETFLDELLEKGGRDAVEGRLALLKPEAGRDRGVLERVADMAGWSGPRRGDRALGVALHESFNSYVAMIAEVSERDGQPWAHKIWCAIDCGVAVNPNIIRAQIEGGIGYGLSAALREEVVLGEGGAVEQGNFDSYAPLRLPEMPAVEVSIIASSEAPTGVGEPGLPPLAPAVGNAWRALTGSTVRRLPIAGSSERA
ncbi:MAG: xanthine dehydrogenase family protein molybdopterin-binding subunit [Pseudomonadota bacterium]